MPSLCTVLLMALLPLAWGNLEAYFAPYDNKSVLQYDIALIENVTRAKLAFDRTASEARKRAAPRDAFMIQFCVYNLLDLAYITPLIAAAESGVHMQVGTRECRVCVCVCAPRASICAETHPGNTLLHRHRPA
jgi:hypothetical protein